MDKLREIKKKILSDFEEYGKSYKNKKKIVSDLKDATAIYHRYDTGDCKGDAVCIYMSKGKLYEVRALHCSCCGLEGQWEPEEVDKEVLLYRSKNGQYYDKYDIRYKRNEEIIEFLEKLG